MAIEVRFFKERQKFSAAHFTLFEDGEVERLHGHNYAVSVSLSGGKLTRGLLFPFHLVKKEIQGLCDAWDERVLLPTRSDWVGIERKRGQVEVQLKTPRHAKFYSFPAEDVALLNCDNISSENLARLFAQGLQPKLETVLDWRPEFAVTIGESSGQEATWKQGS